MKPLTDDEIRQSFVNAGETDVNAIPMPGLHEVIWGDREYLGWRDPKAPQRGYLVHWSDDRPVGILLRASEFSLEHAISAMCSFCRITQPSHQVSMFTAPRAGKAGIDGNTIGTYICDDLACSLLIRILPSASPLQPDPSEVLERRRAQLTERVNGFTANVLRTV